MKGFSLRAVGATVFYAAALALAQPLADLAPAESVFTLGYRSGAAVEGTLLDELRALDWARARETLRAVSQAGLEAGAEEGGDLEAFFDLVARPAGLLEALVGDCAPLAEAVAAEDVSLLGEEALLSVSMSPFNPLPAVTALVSLTGPQLAAAERVQEAILACAHEEGEEGVLILEEGGVPLYVLGDGGDLPVVIGRVDGLFFAGTSPDAVRGVVRRAGGADEPSLAGSRLAGLARGTLSGEGLSLGLDFAALAEALGGLVGVLADGPETERLLRRGLAALRTLGGFAAALSVTPEGVLFESLSAVDEGGGDAALADLLRCEDCALSHAVAVPEGSVGVTGGYLPLKRLFDYAQGWLDDAAPLLGERIDLREALAQEGLDIDAALLDWVGEEVYTVTLEPLSSDLASLIYRPARAMFVAVTDEAAAQAGLETLATRLPELVGDLGDGSARAFAGVAAEGYEERGVQVRRYRYGPNLDVAVAPLGGFLVIASPAYALSRLIEASELVGAGADAPAGYRAALEAAPARLSGFHYSDDRATVLSLADLGSLLSQPLAFVVAAGLEAAAAEADAAEADAMEAGGAEEREPGVTDDESAFSSREAADLAGIAPVPATVPASIRGALTADDPGAVYYELTGLSPGEAVTVTLESDLFDTYLSLIDRAAGTVIAVNDDFEGSTARSRITFLPEEGATYWLGVSSFGGRGSGEFRLSAAPAEGAADSQGHTPVPVDLSGQGATVLALSESLEGVLHAGASRRVADYYALDGIAPGEAVTVTLRSDAFDTYLALIDGASGRYLAENDDFGGISMSQLRFVAREGVSYWVEVTSYGGRAGGDYTLTLAATPSSAGQAPDDEPAPDDEASAEEGQGRRAELPTFADLLHLADLLPQALFTLGERLDASEGYRELRPEGVYSRRLMRVDW